MKLEEIVLVLKKRIKPLEKLIKERREKIGSADNRNQSRYITATRWAMENEITMAEDDLGKTLGTLRELEALIKNKKKKSERVKPGVEIEVKINGKKEIFLITKRAEDLSLGILSTNLSLAKACLGARVNDLVTYKNNSGEKMEIEIVKIE